TILCKTYLSKRMLQCFLHKNKIFLLNNRSMPKWIGIQKKTNTKFTKNIFEFFTMEITMINEVNIWVNCDKFLSVDRIKLIKSDIFHWAQLDCILMCFLMNSEKFLIGKQDNHLIENYKKKLMKFDIIDQKTLDAIIQ